MTKTYLIEGMSCGSCVAKVKSALLKVEGVEDAGVQLQSPQATIKMKNDIPSSIFQSELNKAGRYKIKETELVFQFSNTKNHSGCC